MDCFDDEWLACREVSARLSAAEIKAKVNSVSQCTHLPAEKTMAKRSVRYGDGAASSCVATVPGRREGMLLPFSLPRVSTTRAASPCRPVFQLLKHPTHVQVDLNVPDQTHRILSLFPSFASASPSPLLQAEHKGASRKQTSFTRFLGHLTSAHSLRDQHCRTPLLSTHCDATHGPLAE